MFFLTIVLDFDLENIFTAIPVDRPSHAGLASPHTCAQQRSRIVMSVKMTFRPVELFGGALVAHVPSGYVDVSNIRQVPDHQEVYLDSEGSASVVFEILERVDKPDQEALKYHLEDLIEADASETRIINTADAFLKKLPSHPAYTLLATTPPGNKQRGQDGEVDFVAIYMTLLRLNEVKTDLLININVPFVKGRYDVDSINLDAGQLGSLGDSAHLIRQEILQTFEIKDWTLFGGED